MSTIDIVAAQAYNYTKLKLHLVTQLNAFIFAVAG